MQTLDAEAKLEDLYQGSMALDASVTARSAASDGPWVLAATILGSSMALIDGTVISVALPVLQGTFRATVSQVQWIVESYALFLASLLLVGGSCADHFGRRLTYVIGIVVFTGASICCGFSTNVHQLIWARAVQGIGGALIGPGSLAIITSTFSEKERGRAIGAWSAFTACSAAIGPLIGGWLVEYASWRWLFFINVPLAFAVVALAWWKVPESRAARTTGTPDWLGAALGTIGLGGLVFGLIETSNAGWRHPSVAGPLIAGVAALAVFLIVEARVESPMLPLTLFRSRNFRGASMLTLFLYAAFAGVIFFLPFNLIQVQGYSPTAAGASILPFILIVLLLSRWSGGLVTRYGPKPPLVSGSLIAASGFTLFALPGVGGTYWTTFFPAVVMLGTGMAMSMTPLTTTIMGAVEEGRLGVGSGVNNVISRMASLLSVAVLGIVFAYVFASQLDHRMSALHVEPGIVHSVSAQKAKLAAIEMPPHIGAGPASLIKRAVAESYVSGFRSVMIIAASLSIMSALSTLFMFETEGQHARGSRRGPPKLRVLRGRRRQTAD